MIDNAVIVNKSNDIIGIAALGVEFYLEPRERVAMRRDMLTTQENFFKRFRNNIEMMFLYPEPNENGKTIKIADNENPFPMAAMPSTSWPTNLPFINVIYSNYAHPAFKGKKTAASPWSSLFLVTPEYDDALSYYSANIPVLENPEQPRFATLIECVIEWANILLPKHGLAGFSVVGPQVDEYAAVFPVLERYPGLNIATPSNFSIAGGTQYNRIKSINWLTILCDSIVEELGGVDTIRSALEPDCKIHFYKGGVVIQAGDYPRLGDSETKQIPEIYRKVAKFVKPVTYTNYRRPLFRVPDDMDDVQETIKWVNRFD